MTTVYFATNRKPDQTAPFGFSCSVANFDPEAVTFAKVDVTGTDLSDESSGILGPVQDRTGANFSALTTNEILGADKNLLVFIHGFDNSFEDAIKRAAFNRLWLSQSGIAEADTTIIAFSWPSFGRLLDTLPHLAADAYRADQAQAGASAYHIAYFLRVIDQLQETFRVRHPDGRVFLLAHSMGNHALAGAVQLWTKSNDPKDGLFDVAVLAAADEVAQTLSPSANGSMVGLRDIAHRICVYFSRIDVAMFVSTTVNLTQRLGYEGPPDLHDVKSFSPEQFSFEDCTDIRDYDLQQPPDATHQYYRRSVTVRRLIAAQFSCAS